MPGELPSNPQLFLLFCLDLLLILFLFLLLSFNVDSTGFDVAAAVAISSDILWDLIFLYRLFLPS